MTFLLFVTAALVAVSGALKLRSTARIGLGLRPLALLEMVTALGLAALVLPGPLSGTVWARWAVPVGIFIMVMSSIDHSVRLRAYRQARSESEGGRLATYVKYLSELPETGGRSDDAAEPGAPGIDFDTPSRDDPTA